MSTPTLSSPADEPRTVAHLTARVLIRHGVTHVFGQSLPSMLRLACEDLGLTQVASRSENAGGYMADGYARITGKPAVVTAQNGPAATLLGRAAAGRGAEGVHSQKSRWQDASNHDQTDKNAFQESDHIGLFHSHRGPPRHRGPRVETTWTRPRMPAWAAWARWLMPPADLLNEAAAASQRHASLGHFPLDRSVAASDAVKAAADLLAGAQRPVVTSPAAACTSSGAAQALAALQEAAHLPTVMARAAPTNGIRCRWRNGYFHGAQWRQPRPAPAHRRRRRCCWWARAPTRTPPTLEASIPARHPYRRRRRRSAAPYAEGRRARKRLRPAGRIRRPRRPQARRPAGDRHRPAAPRPWEASCSVRLSGPATDPARSACWRKSPGRG